MDNLKFRAWDKDNKKMLYVDNFSSRLTFMTWDGHSYDNGKLLNYTFLQYTGLKDKDKKEIYEGDIVCILYPMSDYSISQLKGSYEIIERNKRKYVRFLNQAIPIKWSDKDARWVLGEMRKSVEEYGTFGKNGGRLSIRGKTYFLLGNIYENPELLK